MNRKDRLLTVQDFVQLTQLSKRMVYRYIEDGTLPAYRLGNIKALRIRESDAWAFIESKRI
jgi:excisionase family DNA binding protein